jgi:hypothetical protein
LLAAPSRLMLRALLGCQSSNGAINIRREFRDARRNA